MRRPRLYGKIAAILLFLLLCVLSGCAAQQEQSSFSFIYMGDAQASPETGDYSQWGELLRSAAEDESRPAFVLLGGDLVNDGGSREEWDAFFAAAGETFKRLPVYPAMGNHDNTELFKELFDLPQNGPPGKEGHFYSFDHGDAHFVILDSNAMGAANPEDIAWLKQDLAATDKSYRIAMFHHPAYTASDVPKDEARAKIIRESFVPLLEDYGVDLVLSGHQHVYMRTHPMKKGEISTGGIVYLIGVSGGKQYPAAYREYAAFSPRSGGGPVYTICTVNEEGISLKTYDSLGHIVDSSHIGGKEAELSLSREQQEQRLTIVLEDSGEERSFTLQELSTLEGIGYEHIYSTVNNWPSPSFYAAKGFKVRRILEEFGDYGAIGAITFRSSDGYEMSFTREQLIEGARWYYPLLKEGLWDGALPVEPILACAYKEGSENMEDAASKPLCLIFGQRNPSENTNPAFVEDITHIIISSREAPAWEAASTFPLEGTIAPGEKVKLQHPFLGLVKLHYTLDGTEPTELSPVYNPSTYQPELNVPITIAQDTVIKVLAVGYGKHNSPVASFRFSVRQE